MKHRFVALSLATLVVSAAVAATQTDSNEDGKLDRTLPTYPEVGLNDGWRNDAGESEMDNRVQIQLGAADAYRFNAGESTHDLVVQDVGSV